jgi:hypothetical protein
VTDGEAPDSGVLGDRDLPALFVAADRYAVQGQRRVQQLTVLGLIASIAAAALGAATIRRGDIEWAGIASAVAFVAATLLTGWLVWGHPEHRWQRARTGAEEIRSLVWCYVAGGGAFGREASDEHSAQQAFLSRLEAVAGRLEGLPLTDFRGGPAITPAMGALRAGSLDTRRSAYVDGRVEAQSHWYQEKAEANRRTAVFTAALTIVLSVVGALLALGRGLGLLDRDLLGVATATIAAVTTWSQTREHEVLARSYAAAAHRLVTQVARAGQAGDEFAWAAYVQATEQIMMHEHHHWVHRRGIELPST